jgi:subtilisin family serine protease
MATSQAPSILYNKLDDAGEKYEHRMDLSYDLFKGVSFKLDNLASEQEVAKQIAAMPEIKQMWPVREYPIPNDKVHWTGNSNTAASAFNTINKRQSSDNDTFSPHVMTQVDKLRARGIRGAGIKVAIVDTGIDYDHPALGGCFGEGCLVSFGTDLVGDAYTGGAGAPQPDDDPDDCGGHGTHVAGIVAAQVNPYGFTGAAPDVTLGAYRVFGCEGSAGNDVLIAAFNQAYQDGADIITASIGGASGWTEDPWAVAVSRIVDAGTPCTVSAGNSGDQGQFYASTAANGKGVASIASVDNTQAPAILLNASYNAANSSSSTSFGWTEGSPSGWGNISLPLWSVNYNTSDPANACTALPDDTPDLSEYLVLIRRGSCTFVQKVENVVAKGAKYVMFYNNAAGATSVAADVEGLLAVGMTTAETGAEWISLLSNGTDVIVNIVDPDSAGQYPSTRDNTATGGFLSTYTSWGPTYELDFYPQFSAPGGLILSTYPLELGGYAVLSGTSMACPLAAAIYALVAEVRGTFDPATLEAVLASTANPNLFHNGVSASPFLAPTTQQGAGMLQAYDAAYTNSFLSVGSISFNDTDNFLESAEFTIRNIGDDEITFALSHVPAATAYTLAVDSIYPQEFPNEFTSSAATIAFSEKEVTVPGGGEATVSLTLTPPTGLTTARLPVYNGYIALNGSDSSSLSLPYLGVAGSMKSATVLDARSSYLTSSTDPAYNPSAANTTFTIPGRNATGSETSTASRRPTTRAAPPSRAGTVCCRTALWCLLARTSLLLARSGSLAMRTTRMTMMLRLVCLSL